MVTSPEKVEMDSHQTCGAGQKNKIRGRDERMAKQKNPVSKFDNVFDI